MRELEARQDETAERHAAVPTDIPAIHPNVAIVYRRKAERLAEGLADPRERDKAAEATRYSALHPEDDNPTAAQRDQAPAHFGPCLPRQRSRRSPSKQ